METSDESFAWTDASSDSSKDMTSTNQNKLDQGSDEDQATRQRKESCSELQEPQQIAQKPRGKKRKKHEVQEENVNNNDFQINGSIKSEPSSDFDVPKRKKRHKTCDESTISNIYNESFHEAEDYLNLRVKQEQFSFVEAVPTKSKKKKKCKVESEVIENQDLELSVEFKNEIDIEEHNLDSSTFVNGEHSEICEIDVGRRKKKKKKKKRLSVDIDTSEILENLDDSYKTKKEKHKEIIDNNSSDGQEFQHALEDNSQIISSTLINNSVLDNDKEQCNNDIQCIKSDVIEERLKKPYRISDRIRFEDGSVDYNLNEYLPKTDISIQLKQFISSNVNLSALQTNLDSDSVISEDDEIWIVKGPHEISVEDFEKTNLALDSKRKVKMNGKTYDSSIDTRTSAVPIVSCGQNKVFIKYMPLMGVINLHKRIPKVHIPYESLITINESSFIPLPDTKCRHPLFGIDYKKATKLPREIAERLNTSNVLMNSNNKKKKKHKTNEKHEIESDFEMKPNVEILHSTKKKKNKGRLEIESETEVELHINASQSNKKKKKFKQEKCDIESDTKGKPITEVAPSSKNKKKVKDEKHAIESDIEVKPDIRAIKKKRKLKENPENPSDIEVKPNMDLLQTNKKKRKHSHEQGTPKKVKRVKQDPSSAEAWDSVQAIEKNLFDF